MRGVLDGLRVLDLSWGIAGPMTAMLLADHGAQVTKVEPPGGDPFRAQPGYKVWQRGKRSAVIDLKHAAQREHFLALAGAADVLIESFAPGVTTRLGIDDASLRAQHPRLIYCSITGYGRGTRDAQRPAYDSLVAARTGLCYEQRGWPGGALRHLSHLPDAFAQLEIPEDWLQGAARAGPLFSALPRPSLGACYAALTGISAALFAREQTGRGQRVETSLLQGAMAAASMVWQRAERPEAKSFDSWILNSRSPKGHFECADGRWIHNWVPNPRFLLRTAEGSGRSDGAALDARSDPDRFGTSPAELVAMSHYQPLLAEAARVLPAREWVAAAARAGISLQEVRSPEEALVDPLLLEDGCVAELVDPELGPIRSVGISYRLATSPGRIQGPAPRVGEHTREVLAEAAALAPRPRPVAAAPAPGASRSPRAALEGIRVLDFGLALAGPFGTQLLSDLGADVIKINALHDGYWHANHIAQIANRGKRSLALDLKHPRARAILERLVARADVVQHNLRADAAERLGIDYPALRALNPSLVYCHTRGFERGPRSLLPGNDQTGGCLAGVQYEDGGMARGGKPLWSLASLGDTGNGFLSAIAILQALSHRERSGEGQFCETSILYAQLLNASSAIAFPDGRGVERPRLDAQQLGFCATHRFYETSDGWLCIAVFSDPHWQRLCAAIGFPRLAEEPRFATASARALHDAELAQRLETAFRRNSTAAWQSSLDAAGVPCEACDPEFSRALFDDPELRERGWVARYPHPVFGQLDQIGVLFDLSETPARAQCRPLRVGEHSREILAELGYAEAEIAELAAARAVDLGAY